MYYYGYEKLRNGKRIYRLFASKSKPTRESYGHVYSHVTGPYKTKKSAIEKFPEAFWPSSTVAILVDKNGDMLNSYGWF